MNFKLLIVPGPLQAVQS